MARSAGRGGGREKAFIEHIVRGEGLVTTTNVVCGLDIAHSCKEVAQAQVGDSVYHIGSRMQRDVLSCACFRSRSCEIAAGFGYRHR
jgi:hypothetical protein